LLARAEPATVVVGDAAVPFLDRRFELSPLEMAETAGPRAHRLVGPGGGSEPRGAALLGRRHDLQLLEAHLAATLTGRGQVVGIVGDAGIGKSRVVTEFCRNLRSDRVLHLEGACFSYATAIPYVPVLGIVRQSCGLAEGDAPETITAQIRRRLETLAMKVEESAPYLLHLFGLREGTEQLAGLTPEAIGRRTLETVCRMIVGAK